MPRKLSLRRWGCNVPEHGRLNSLFCSFVCSTCGVLFAGNGITFFGSCGSFGAQGFFL
jgi:hypothetical protein